MNIEASLDWMMDLGSNLELLNKHIRLDVHVCSTHLTFIPKAFPSQCHEDWKSPVPTHHCRLNCCANRVESCLCLRTFSIVATRPRLISCTDPGLARNGQNSPSTLCVLQTHEVKPQARHIRLCPGRKFYVAFLDTAFWPQLGFHQRWGWFLHQPPLELPTWQRCFWFLRWEFQC